MIPGARRRPGRVLVLWPPHAVRAAGAGSTATPVAVCLGCARFVALRAREIEDRGRGGPAVRVRDVVRGARRAVVDRGLHDTPIVGAGLRWLGRQLP